MDLALAPGRAAKLVAAFGERGRRFVEGLPRTLASVTRDWEVRLTESLAADYAVVFAGESTDGREVVLKLRVPDAEARAEASALAWFDGDGAIPLLATDPDRGALLLPRVRPGEELTGLDEDAATEVICDLVRRLTRRREGPLPDDLPTVEGWADGFERVDVRHPDVDAGRTIFRSLCRSAGASVVLHGDLHHTNVLRAGPDTGAGTGAGRFVAIDPHGVVGEAAYEIGAFVRNPISALEDHPGAEDLVARRLDVLAERLGADRRRLHAWSFAQATLAACWDVEEGADPARSLRIAEIIGRP